VHGVSLPLQVPLPKPAALSELGDPYPDRVPRRLLRATPASADESVLGLLPALREALNGSGPALALHGPEQPPPGTGDPIELAGPDDDAHDPTAVAVTTSGSTGAAKTVLLPASALLASAGATHDRLGGSGHWPAVLLLKGSSRR